MHTDTYWDHISDGASVASYHETGKIEQPLISAETMPESGALIDFKAFAIEYPDKLFPLLDHLRPEFKEIFIEYYILGKSQCFLAQVHGTQQSATRGIWQNLRVIEQAIGALIVLGVEPKAEDIRPILESVDLENSPLGSLTEMICQYNASRSYAEVAKFFKVPTPAIRKIFRPAIEKLLARRGLKAVALGAFIRNITHQASLTKDGFSNSYRTRLKRIERQSFDAPEPENSALINSGKIDSLGDMPWSMFEISPEYTVDRVFSTIRKAKFYVFREKAGQVFAPVDARGDLKLGYFFARGNNKYLATAMTRLRGICEVSSRYDDQGEFKSEVLIPDAEIQALIHIHNGSEVLRAKVGDFVEILTGDAARYCGDVKSVSRFAVEVEINFPSGRKFFIHALHSSVKSFGKIPKKARGFWGVIQSGKTF
jgi:hypothetical protein